MGTTAEEADDLVDVVDTGRYPLHDPAGSRWEEVTARVRRDLRERGCSVLPELVRPELHETLRREGEAVAAEAHHEVSTVNVYNTAPDDALARDHPARVTMQRGNAFVPRTSIPPDSLVARLYTSPALQRLVAGCVGLPQVHELADPLSGLVLNVLRPGRSHPWHFDTNDLAVTMLTREPEGGGVFEFHPGIRSPQAENLDDVAAVLRGTSLHAPQRLQLRVGDLQLFAGRYSLHRVTAVEGAGERHTAIFAYSARPGVVGSLERTRQLFGQVTPVHESAARDQVRPDALLD